MNTLTNMRAAWLLVLMLALTGCMHNDARPVTALDALEQAEATITAGWQALGDAIALGAVPLNSQDHRRYYNALARADSLLDQAWQVYTAGDDNGARTQVRIALELYEQIRPALLAEGDR